MTNPDDVRERRRRIRESVDQETGCLPVGWKDDPGAVIAGTFQRAVLLPDKFNPGRKRLAIVLTDDDTGQDVTIYCRTVLQNKLLEARPEHGEWLCIKCHGDPEDRGYVNYTLGTEADADRGVWDAVAAEQSPDRPGPKPEGGWALAAEASGRAGREALPPDDDSIPF
jgi:hypothetical protein